MIVDDLRAVTPIAAKPLDEYLASVTDEVVTERYLERMIDPRRVYEGLQAAVRDIPEYLRHVHRHIEASG